MKFTLQLICFVLLGLGSAPIALAAEVKLHDFGNNFTRDAYSSYAGLVADGDTLFGTSYNGGQRLLGAIFKINSDGSAYERIYSFDPDNGGPIHPEGGLILDGGFLYGVTVSGGEYDKGAVFRVDQDGSNFTVLFSYGAATSGAVIPDGQLTLLNGMFYGVSDYGGTTNQGAVYKLSLDGLNFQVLHSFGSVANDGFFRSATGASGAAGTTLLAVGGTLYGTTPLGGSTTAATGGIGYGTVFKIGIDGSGYQVLHSFWSIAKDGANPHGGLTLIGSTIYGAAPIGGAYNAGMLFQVNTDGSAYKAIHNFHSVANDGTRPVDGLLALGDTLYGVTDRGGRTSVAGTNGDGIAFKLNKDGTGYKILHNFGLASQDGEQPNGPLVRIGTALFGTTQTGGANTYNTGTSYRGTGTIFKISGSDVFTPAVVTSPESIMVGIGEFAAFQGSFFGDGLSFQWLKNTTAISKATQDTYTVNEATLAHAGAYALKASNTGGSSTSLTANLGVVDKADTVVSALDGKTLTITVLAGGPGLSYEWRKGGAKLNNGINPLNSASIISGATSAKLSISKATINDEGGYTCEVTMPDPQHAGTPLRLESGIFTVFIVGKPTITTQPTGPMLVGTDEPVGFSVVASNPVPPANQWLRNGVVIKGANAPAYDIVNAKLTDAGTYSATLSNIAGSTNSNSAKLGVVSQTINTVTVNEAGTLILKVSATAPPGTAFTYQWRKDAGDLVNGINAPPQVVSGATTATLTIKKASAATAGSYTCNVGMEGLSKESGAFLVAVRLKPTLDPAGLMNWFVSGLVTDSVAAQNSPTSYAFTGLPTGVTGNRISGQLSGKPNKPTTSPRTFTVTAANAAGRSPALVVSYTVTALSANVVGTFDALVDRDTTLSAPIAAPAGQKLHGLGGNLEHLVVSSTGAFTGTLKLEEKRYVIPTGSRLDAHGSGNPTARVTFKRGPGITDLTMDLTFHFDTNELTGTLSDGLAVTPVKLQGWRNVWKATTTAGSPANAAMELAGRYNAMFDFADGALEGNATYPQGNGHGTLTITTAGLATWYGMLADGTVVTSSTTVGPQGEVPLHWMLYTPTVAATAGSAHGWIQAQAGSDTTTPDDNTLDTLLDLTQADPKDQPMFDWMKQPQPAGSRTRSYKDGIPLHKLKLIGGGYVKPDKNVPVLGLTADTTDNAKLTFSAADIETTVTYQNAANGGPAGSLAGKVFTITKTNTVIMPKLPSVTIANPATLTLTINTSTGAFNGSFTLRDDPDPTDHIAPITLLSRSRLKFSGLLVPRLGTGLGCFQLPQLPTDGPPKTTVSTSQLLSGQVLLEAAP